MEKKTESHVSLGFAEALTLLFITLKLTGYISWSWLWVLSPIWITLIVILALTAAVLVIGAIAKWYRRGVRRRYRR